MSHIIKRGCEYMADFYVSHTIWTNDRSKAYTFCSRVFAADIAKSFKVTGYVVEPTNSACTSS